MDNKKRNVQVESDGSRSAPVPLWQELPQITVRPKEGNTIYRFTASFDGTHTLPEKAVKLIDSESSSRSSILSTNTTFGTAARRCVPRSGSRENPANT